MDTVEIARLGQDIWQDRMSLEQIVVAMGVVYGDIARVARDRPRTEDDDLRRELGNMIVSTIRWCGHLDLDIDQSIREALKAQRAWQKSRRTD